MVNSHNEYEDNQIVCYEDLTYDDGSGTIDNLLFSEDREKVYHPTNNGWMGYHSKIYLKSALIPWNTRQFTIEFEFMKFTTKEEFAVSAWNDAEDEKNQFG